MTASRTTSTWKRCFTLFIGVLLLQSHLLHAMSGDEFKHWWKEYKKSPAVPTELVQMIDYFVSTPAFGSSSQYWNHLNKQNIEQITTLGYKNFKQSVSRNYFTWVVAPNHPYAQTLMQMHQDGTLKMAPLPVGELEKTHAYLSATDSFNYNYITALLLSYQLQYGKADLLDQLDEPTIGNPLSISYNGKQISQDSLNSLMEFNAISSYCPLDKISTVIEIGAGSGRTAFCFMKLMPHVKYIIVDIPPALYLSQKYLTEVFPEKKHFHFRPFSHFHDIKKEFEDADLIFLTPEQLQQLPCKIADLFLAIDCLHEMRPEFIQFYFNEANRLASYIYFKCWLNTVIPYDGYHYTSEDYTVPAAWTLLFKDRCIVPSDFFHTAYKID